MRVDTHTESRKPRPRTTRAILISEGFREPRPTEHVYIATRKVPWGQGWAYSHVFRCQETGADRRWGLDGPPDEVKETEEGS